MLSTARLGFSVLLFFFGPAEAAMNKCTDGKQITYTTEPCEKTGLKPAGPIKESVTVMSLMPKVQNAEPAKREKIRDDDEVQDARAAIEDSEAGMPKPTKIKPVSPLIRKLLD